VIVNDLIQNRVGAGDRETAQRRAKSHHLNHPDSGLVIGIDMGATHVTMILAKFFGSGSG